MIVNLLANNGYIVLNKTLMKKVGLHEAILLGELSAEYVYWKKRNELQGDYFYSTRENIEEQTMLSSHQQRIAIENLKKQNILKVKQVGMPLRTWYSINEQNLYEILLGNGLKSSSEKIEHHVVKKFDTNNNKNNNKNNKIDRLFNYIINNDEEFPKGFTQEQMKDVISLLKKFEMFYTKEMIEIFDSKTIEKIKTITYVISMLAKANVKNVNKNFNRDKLISIYDWCKEKEKLYENTELKINDFVSYYYKSVVNELLKQNKTNYVANKAKEGEDDNEEYECPE